MERRQMLKCLLTGGAFATLSARLPAQVGAQRPQSPENGPPRVANTNGNGGAARPENNVLVANPQELEKILQEWEQKTAKITRLRGTHQRYEYDTVFAVEKRAVGEFWHEAPDKGRIDFDPPKNPPKQSPKIAPNGQPYQIQVEDPQTWMCDGKDIFFVEHTPKTYGVSNIPPHLQGENIMDGPLPFLFGMKADAIKSRYKLSLGSQHDPEGKVAPRPQYHIVALPILQKDARNWQRAEVILDAEWCLPTAIRLFDPGGTKETVYVFPLSDIKGNETLWWKLNDPFKMSLRGYKLVDQQVAPPQNQQPKGGKGVLGRAVQPAGGTAEK